MTRTSTGVETLRRPVQPSDCDILGHMNVARYVDAISDAMFGLQAQVGLGRAEIDATRLSFVAARIEADYRAELKPGDVIVVASRVLHVGTKSARFAHRLYRAEDMSLAFEAQNVSVLFHLDDRRSAAIPADLRAALEALIDPEDATHAA